MVRGNYIFRAISTPLYEQNIVL